MTLVLNYVRVFTVRVLWRLKDMIEIILFRAKCHRDWNAKTCTFCPCHSYRNRFFFFIDSNNKPLHIPYIHSCRRFFMIILSLVDSNKWENFSVHLPTTFQIFGRQNKGLKKLFYNSYMCCKNEISMCGGKRCINGI